MRRAPQAVARLRKELPAARWAEAVRPGAVWPEALWSRPLRRIPRNMPHRERGARRTSCSSSRR